MATIVFRARSLTLPDVELRPSGAELAKPDFDAAWKRLCERVERGGEPCEAGLLGESPARALHRVWLPAVSRAAAGLDPFPPRPGTPPAEPEFVAPAEPEFVAPAEPEFAAPPEVAEPESAVPLVEESAASAEPEFAAAEPEFLALEEPAMPVEAAETPSDSSSTEPATATTPPTAARLTSRGAGAKPKTRRR